eukprot:TRINITY_DN12475_c0_g4_i2.p1 TRINITY_DN12475_c0_g4~~TRINITY_DN12475_c0_g4_i2.p1  ORF type:complete len:470 (+),score=77.55 TRINITY_DN12475_c0_g4_i2:121-1410(+)
MVIELLSLAIWIMLAGASPDPTIDVEDGSITLSALDVLYKLSNGQNGSLSRLDSDQAVMLRKIAALELAIEDQLRINAAFLNSSSSMQTTIFRQQEQIDNLTLALADQVALQAQCNRLSTTRCLFQRLQKSRVESLAQDLRIYQRASSVNLSKLQDEVGALAVNVSKEHRKLNAAFNDLSQSINASLTEVVSDLTMLEIDNDQLEVNVEHLRGDMQNAVSNITQLDEDVQQLEQGERLTEQELRDLEDDFQEFEGRVTELTYRLHNVTLNISIVEAETRGIIAAQEGIAEDYDGARSALLNETYFNKTALTRLVESIADDGHEEEMAQAACAGLPRAPKSSWMLAVRRACTSAAPACPEVCASQLVKDQDGQTRGYTWTAYDSLHVYGRIHKDPAPDTSISSVKLSYKMFIYGGAGGGCGPNFCCCRAP